MPSSATPASVEPSTSPSAGPVSLESIAQVPTDVDKSLALCFDDPDVNDGDGGRPLGCPDLVTDLGRAIAAVGQTSVVRLFIDRSDCHPCDDIESNLADGYAEDVAGGSWHVTFNGLVEAIEVERIDGPTPWPETQVVPRPPLGRAPLDHPSPELASRPPLPYCGTHDIGAARPDETALLCFRESVIAGLPAEVLLIRYGIEGGKQSDLLRFTGSGAIVQYTQGTQADPSKWTKSSSMMILAPLPSTTWSPSGFGATS